VRINNLWFFLISAVSISGQAQPTLIKESPTSNLGVVWNLETIYSEISGLTAINTGNNTPTFLAIQDGGNATEIMVCRWVERKIEGIKVPLVNSDWEAIVVDSSRVYLGDFGNNRGNRKDLKIYRCLGIPSNFNNVGDLSQALADNHNWDSIQFNFPDQANFSPRFRHNFDCEAMLVRGDSIWLFTKNWRNFRSQIYLLENKPGRQVALPVAELKPRCLVTDACWVNGGAVLLGYSVLGNQFIMNVDWAKKRISKKRKLAIKPAQMEGVAFNPGNNKIYVSTEKRKTQQAAIIELCGN